MVCQAVVGAGRRADAIRFLAASTVTEIPLALIGRANTRR